MAPRCIVEAVAQRRAAVVRIPPVQAAPADERPVGDTIHGQPRPGALLCHLPASRDEPLGAHAFAPRRRVPVAQHVGAAVQREEVVRIRVVEGTQSEASGVQRGGGQRRARHVPSRDWWPINQTSDAGHSATGFLGGRAERRARSSALCRIGRMGSAGGIPRPGRATATPCGRRS